MGMLKQNSCHVVLLLILFITISLNEHYCYLGFRGASAASIIDGEWFPGGNQDDFGGGEILLSRNNAAGGRLLLQSDSSISYKALQPGPVCGTAQYSNCIVSGNSGGGCSGDYNRCKRAVLASDSKTF
ncbi:OLC1v1009788C1 [Oldenlandia corymbosa var. corymbosa]|uniref:OLC1v1009788C1 n=1 Tax=Oldenlandia corymbosa var. corymbosa TaxID=529605 RepID=A0AAV1DPQ2_OLDCO|nr:OLC1v1009788C1 [Oldenlandia corymbosa var. corymbosa]